MSQEGGWVGVLLFDHVNNRAGGVMDGQRDNIAEHFRFFVLREFDDFVKGFQDLEYWRQLSTLCSLSRSASCVLFPEPHCSCRRASL